MPPATVWDESSDKAHWKNRAPGQPFFAVFNFTVTHESQVWSRANDQQITDPRDVTVPPYYPDTPLIRKDIARHYDNIALMDKMAGQVLDELKNSGLMDSTIVFFFSDHGDGFPRAKRWIYDSGIQVPLLIRYPDRRMAGMVSDQLVSFIDFGPTVLSLVSISVPSHMQGRPFAGGQEKSPRKYIYAAKDRMDPAMDNQRAVRDQRFKYIKNYMPDRPYVQFLPYRDQMTLMQELFRCEEEGQLDPVQQLWFRKTKPLEELYDTWNDPYEVNNLAEDPAFSGILEELREVHLKWKEETNDWALISEKELIKKLWPPDGDQPTTEKPEFFMVDPVDTNQISLEIYSSTQGASIGYRINEEVTWHVYHNPLIISETDTVKAMAHRIGYKPSEVVLLIPAER